MGISESDTTRHCREVQKIGWISCCCTSAVYQKHLEGISREEHEVKLRTKHPKCLAQTHGQIHMNGSEAHDNFTKLPMSSHMKHVGTMLIVCRYCEADINLSHSPSRHTGLFPSSYRTPAAPWLATRPSVRKRIHVAYACAAPAAPS